MSRREVWWHGVSGVTLEVISAALGVLGLVRMHDSSVASRDRKASGAGDGSEQDRARRAVSGG